MNSTEYWERAASLLHTDIDGKRDLPVDPNVRIYLVSGAAHLGAAAPERHNSQNLRNPLRHRGPVLRALLVAMDDWITVGKQPPASRYPRIDDRTLVDIKAFRAQFPAIPGFATPADYYQPRRLDPGPRWHSDGIATIVPPRVGRAYRTLVPAVDADGNERAGIRLPDVAVPRATYTGWNLRHPSIGAPDRLAGLHGSYAPFAETDAERRSTGDPRPSIHERYPTHADYVERYTAAVRELQHAGFLLDTDAADLILRASKHVAE